MTRTLRGSLPGLVHAPPPPAALVVQPQGPVRDGLQRQGEREDGASARAGWPPRSLPRATCTIALAMARPNPAPRASTDRGAAPVELVEHRLSISPRSSRGPGLPPRPSPRSSPADTRMSTGASGGRVLERVVQQVEEHLLDHHSVERDQREIGRQMLADHPSLALLPQPARGPSRSRPPGGTTACRRRSRRNRAGSWPAGSRPAGRGGWTPHRPPRARPAWSRRPRLPPTPAECWWCRR